MASCYATSRTNLFRVTDEKKYQELFYRLDDLNYGIEDLTVTDKDGVIWHGFGNYETILFQEDDWYFSDEADDKSEPFDFLKEIRELLPEGEAFTYCEVRYESLQCVERVSTIVTKNGCETIDLTSATIQCARKLLNDPSWEMR